MDSTNIIYGIHPVAEAIKSGVFIDKVLVNKTLKGEGFQMLRELCKQNNIYLNRVPEEKIRRIIRKGNHQGVVAFVSPVEFYSLQEILPSLYEQGKTPFIIVLDRVTDIRNFGAIIRTAECFGVHAIVIPQKGAASVNQDVVKTSAGAVFNIPICKEKSLVNALKFMKDYGLEVYSATEKASSSCYEQTLQIPCALVLGSEGEGISEDILRLSDKHLKIPIVGSTGSFNVSVAAGILMYEIARQEAAKKH
jgi:23S rRNA (guanosine2251-2'-O)-methyltransferase